MDKVKLIVDMCWMYLLYFAKTKEELRDMRQSIIEALCEKEISLDAFNKS